MRTDRDSVPLDRSRVPHAVMAGRIHVLLPCRHESASPDPNGRLPAPACSPGRTAWAPIPRLDAGSPGGRRL